MCGKINWFDALQRHGVLSSVDGGTFFFKRTPAEAGLPTLEEGDLVSFEDVGDGRLGRMAANVRPLRRRAAEQHPRQVTA